MGGCCLLCISDSLWWLPALASLCVFTLSRTHVQMQLLLLLPAMRLCFSLGLGSTFLDVKRMLQKSEAICTHCTHGQLVLWLRLTLCTRVAAGCWLLASDYDWWTRGRVMVHVLYMTLIGIASFLFILVAFSVRRFDHTVSHIIRTQPAAQLACGSILNNQHAICCWYCCTSMWNTLFVPLRSSSSPTMTVARHMVDRTL